MTQSDPRALALVSDLLETLKAHKGFTQWWDAEGAAPRRKQIRRELIDKITERLHGKE